MAGRVLIAMVSLAFAASPAVAAPSDPDPSFGQDGLSLVNALPFVRGAAPTPDGGIAVAGDQFTVTKLTPAGALDLSFGVDGTATAPVPAPRALFRSAALLVQDDGRIVIGGQIDPEWDGNPYAHFALARFLADGTPDLTFGSGGIVVMSVSPTEADSMVNALASVPGGGILACGVVGTQGLGTLALAQFDSRGRLDPSFGPDGIVLGPAGFCDGMARGPGGTILLAGSVHYSSINPTFMAARYLANGTPDRSFASGGLAITTIPIDFSCRIGVLAQPDGKVVLTGSFDSRYAVVRLDASGRPDPTFGTAGVATTAATQSLYCGPSALQANGKIVLTGGQLVPPSFRRVAVARYRPDGSLDASFSAGGPILPSMGSGEYTDAGAMALQPDGKIDVIGDVGDTHGDLYLASWRLLGDGPGGAPADPDALGWRPPPVPNDDPGQPPDDPQSAGTPPTTGDRSSAAHAALHGHEGSGPSGQRSEASGSAPHASSPSAGRASLRAVTRALHRTLSSRRARRALGAGGLALQVVLPAGDRLSVALPDARSPHETLAYGVSTAASGRTQLRLITTRAGRRQLTTSRPLRLTLRTRLVSTKSPALEGTTTITLPSPTD